MHAPDKLTLDLTGTDNEALAERISRMQPGDELELAGGSCFTLDESDGKLATFSVKEIKLTPDGDEKADEDDDDEEEDEKPSGKKKISVEWAKNRSKSKKPMPEEEEA